MKTHNTEVLVALGDADELTFSVISPKTGKMLTMSREFVPAYLVKQIELAVFIANNQMTGRGRVELTVEDFQSWKDAHEAYAADLLARDEAIEAAMEEPYEVRFGPSWEETF